MNKCCTNFIIVCYFNRLDMDILNYNYCPECGTQMRRKLEELKNNVYKENKI